MCGRGDAGQAFEERVGGGVEELVGDAEDPAVADGFEGLPVSLGDDAIEGDAIPCSAPGEEEDVGVVFGYGFGGSVSARFAEVFAAGGFDFGFGVLCLLDVVAIVDYYGCAFGGEADGEHHPTTVRPSLNAANF